MSDEHGRKEYFDNTVGIGFGAIVTIRSHKLPVVRGFLMYLTAVIQTIVLDHNPIAMQIPIGSEAAFVGVVYFGDPVTWRLAAGSLLILGSVVAVQVASWRGSGRPTGPLAGEPSPDAAISAAPG